MTDEAETPAKPTLIDRVAARSRNVKLLRVILWVLAAPFYALGFLAALAWVALLFAGGALIEGFKDLRVKASQRAGGT